MAPSGNDSAPGTLIQPWRTIQHAADTVGPGDQVLIRGGTYRELLAFRNSGLQQVPVSGVELSGGNRATFDFSLSGVKAGDYLYVYRSWASNNGVFEIEQVGQHYVVVAGSPFVNESEHVQASIATPVIFKRYPNETVTLDKAHADCSGPVVAFNSVNYVIVDGFRVTSSCHAGVAIFNGSHYNAFRNGVVFGNDRPGIIITSENSSAGNTYNIIERNEIFDNGLNGPGEGVYIGMAYEDDDSDYNHVLHNYIHHPRGGHEGTDVKHNTVGTVIEGNTYENSNSTYGVILLAPNANGSLIYGNVLKGSSGSDQYAGAITITGPNNMIFNNLIYQSTGLDGIYLYRYPGNRVFNNTIYEADVGIGFDYDGPGISGTELKNNILSGNSTQISGSTGGVVINHNLFDGPSEVYGENPIEADPRFINPANGDLRLNRDSPAIDSGLDVQIPTDLDKRLRPQGDRYDLGAFESAA